MAYKAQLRVLLFIMLAVVEGQLGMVMSQILLLISRVRTALGVETLPTVVVGAEAPTALQLLVVQAL
jgi:hypothetical protein